MPIPIIDAHIHLPSPSLTADLPALLDSLGVERANLVATPDQQLINHNPALIHCKSHHPQRVYMCGALDYFSSQFDPTRLTTSLAEQVKTLQQVGFDGLKLLESKPMVRKMLPLPLDGPIYAPMWAAVEALGLPVVWHVADPETFWDPDLCPDWAKSSGWFYGDGSYPAKEAFYREVENILTRHPGLKVILAHFYFLSADLERAADFLEAHPNACFDLTPGSEMYFNFAYRLPAARSFFLRYQERLLFGTDIGASAIGKGSVTAFDRSDSHGRAWVVRRFLENDGSFDLPEGVRRWARPGDILQGIGLPAEALSKIYSSNFERLFGKQPAPLKPAIALDLVERQAALIDALAGTPVESPARLVANEIKSRLI